MDIEKIIDEEIEKLEEEKNRFQMKWKHFVSNLNHVERKIMASHLKKPSLETKLQFCSAIADATAGKINDDALKKREKEANLKLKKARQRAN